MPTVTLPPLPQQLPKTQAEWERLVNVFQNWAKVLTPQTGTFQLTGVGFQAPAPVGTATYVYTPGVLAIVNLGLFGTSNSTSFSMTGLPAFLQPATYAFQSMPALIEDNSAEVANGALGVNAGSGTLTMFKGGSTTGFAASGGKGADGNYTWMLI